MLRRVSLPLWSVLIGGAAGLPLAAHATNGYFSHGYGVQAEGMAGPISSSPSSAGRTSGTTGSAWGWRSMAMGG
ncbi:hypothetical protein [Ideonella benzenivorans]|uniref:hypothetical protein n=1 Tax=Ideonella benzenivorans TaxID=2831643 RepID=UPI001CEC7F43|nr:hypothetical protein [Ideonella benzenivorans]